jgi:hypothetical protein
MPRMADTVSVGANATVDNVLSGKLYEILKRPSALRFLAAAAATGIKATIVVGSEVIVDDALVSLANRYPVIPDDTLAEHGGFAHDRLVFRLRNTTAGAIVVNWVVDVTEVA